MYLWSGAAMRHSQGHEPTWEKSYIAYPGKETTSNIHEWVMALMINRDIVHSALALLCDAQGLNSTRKKQDKLSLKSTSTMHNSPR